MSMSSSSSARQNMLKSQILTGHVLNSHVLDALQATPRESFVPAQYQGVAYIDEEIPLGNGRFLLEPLAFARMLEHAAITKQQTVLVVACGSGYSAVIAGQLARQVIAVEENPTLAAQAKQHLTNVTNAQFIESSLVAGAPQHAPYDIILIEGAIEYLPQALADQLKEGGRLLAFEQLSAKHIGTSGANVLVEYKKIHNHLYRAVICDASVALLSGFSKPAMFAF